MCSLATADVAIEGANKSNTIETMDDSGSDGSSAAQQRIGSEELFSLRPSRLFLANLAVRGFCDFNSGLEIF
jgi:hypothetical protein